MSAWSDLPNAVHIDRIIESVKSHTLIWNAARDAAWGAAWYAARDTARDTAWAAARDAVRLSAWGAARGAAWDAGRAAARAAARVAASDAILALIAWDDSTEFLDMTSDELEVWARLSDDPRAILLLPAVRAFERIKELETA